MTRTGLDRFPSDVADAILEFREAAFRDGRKNQHVLFSDAVSDAQWNLIDSILAALESERELRERAERLRQQVIWEWRHAGICQDELVRRSAQLLPGDLAADLTATSSAHDTNDGRLPPPGPANIVARSPNPLPPPHDVRTQ